MILALSDEFIMSLKSLCNIEDIISGYTSLRRDGHTSRCLCLFHSEKTPSMVVYNNTQSFYCFGCGAGGDVVSFVMKIQNLDYIESLKFLCNHAKIEFPTSDNAYEDKYKNKRMMLEINRESAKFFHNNIKMSINSEARKYLQNRNINDNIIIRYGLGFAQNSFNSLFNYLREKKYKIDDIEQAKVINKSKKGSYYDVFRNRIIFPIIDLQGNVIGFGGRVLDESKPKYLNSSDTLVFKKSNNLFSMNFAKNNKDDFLILVEGYMDAISLYQAGFQNVVATLGTALTREQARLISRYAKKEVIIAYDSDKAGKSATSRAFSFLREVGIKVKVLSLDETKDPDEYIKKYGADRFRNLIKKSDNIIDFEILNIKSKYNIENSQDKILYVKDVMNLISKIPNSIDREVYILNLCNETDVSKSVVSTGVDRLIKNRIRYQDKKSWKEIQNNKTDKNILNGNGIVKTKIIKSEQAVLYFLMKNPEWLKDIKSRLDQSYFETQVNKKIYNYLVEKIENNSIIDVSLFAKELSLDEIALISGIEVSFSPVLNSKEQLYEYIDLLEKNTKKLEKKDILDMSPQEIRDFYKDYKQ